MPERINLRPNRKPHRCIALSLILLSCIAGFAISSALPAQTAQRTWTLTTAPNNSYTSIASSADGSTIIAGSQVICISTNGGASWDVSPSGPYGYVTSVAISADGSHMVAMNYWNWIYASKDGGVSWTQVAGESNFWQSIAISRDGHLLSATSASDGTNQSPGHIYSSSDGGATWNQSDAAGYWSAVASSGDGARLIAVSSDGRIFASTNFGSAWLPTSAPIANWSGIASSADGNKFAAATSGGPIYTSPDGGSSWTMATNAPLAKWNTISLSSDGSRLAAAEYGGQVFLSDDGGATWVSSGIPDAAQGYGWTAAQSADGTRVISAGIGPHSGLIYLLHVIPSLGISQEVTNIVVSWPTTALGFYLEQASDLGTTNWTNAVLSSRTINGQNRVLLDRSAGNQFLRLGFPTGTLPMFGRPPPIMPPPPS